MPGFAPLYGRVGPQASGDPMVADLLTRTVENQFRATTTLDQMTAQLTADPSRRWLAPSAHMAVLHAHWIAAMLWQMATAYLDGAVNQYSSFGQLPQAVYQECDALCDLASSAMLHAIQQNGRLAQNAIVPDARLILLPTFQLHGEGYAGIWRALEAVYLQVSDDLRIIAGTQIPKRMVPVWNTIIAAVRPNLDAFDYLRQSWRTTRVDDNRRQIVSDAASIVNSLYYVGQHLSAPALLGPTYVTAYNYKPPLEELELGFDPWVLTDGMTRTQLEKQPQARQELADFWNAVADPAAVRQTVEALQAAIRADRVRCRTGYRYQTVPWPSQYLVRYPVSFAPRNFVAGDLILAYPSWNEDGKLVVEIRRTGHVSDYREMLGQ